MRRGLRQFQVSQWPTSRNRNAVLFVVASYVVLRLMNLFMLAVVARSQGTSLTDLIFRWDSQWLVRAAEQGWTVPAGGLAEVSEVQTTWAWPPLAPVFGRWGSAMFGLDAGWILVLINVTAGGLAALLLWRVVADSFGSKVGVVAAVLWSAMPASPVFLMAYAEGLFLALAFGSLLAMQRSHHVLAGALLIPAGLTKVQVVPFAAALVVVVLMRRWKMKSAGISASRMVASLLLAATSVAAWPVFVATQFGAWNAYTGVQKAWNYWEPWPFVVTVKWLANTAAFPNRATLFALLAVAVSMAAMVVVFRNRQTSLSLKVVSATGPAFLLAVGAGASTVRYVLSFPAIPVMFGLWARTRARFLYVLAALLVTQLAWIAMFVAAGPTEMPP